MKFSMFPETVKDEKEYKYERIVFGNGLDAKGWCYANLSITNWRVESIYNYDSDGYTILGEVQLFSFMNVNDFIQFKLMGF